MHLGLIFNFTTTVFWIVSQFDVYLDRILLEFASIDHIDFYSIK